jgi:hypothetical protein
MTSYGRTKDLDGNIASYHPSVCRDVVTGSLASMDVSKSIETGGLQRHNIGMDNAFLIRLASCRA